VGLRAQGHKYFTAHLIVESGVSPEVFVVVQAALDNGPGFVGLVHCRQVQGFELLHGDHRLNC
jgi:hypothetical protein